ncbi:MAG: P-type conjugative transfer protein TrbG [Pseudomonadota bacterium]|nr:P-type conjugative transfer protein TrbG [Pseudomonadota bacterium]
MKYLIVTVSLVALSACASKSTLSSFADDPAQDSFIEAKVIADPAPPVQIVEKVKPLPLPGQLMKLGAKGQAIKEVDDPLARVDQANTAATKEPVKSGYVNAIQVYPYSQGALYRLYGATNQVSDITLQQGEKLVSVSTGDTVRWIVGDTTSGAGLTQQVHILVKPIAADLKTNLVITSERRTYHLELESTEATYMSSLSWTYPEDELISIRKKNDDVAGLDSVPIEGAQTFDNLNFRYRIEGSASFAPSRVFDDGTKVYIQFPSSLPQGEAPPLFVQGSEGKPALVNYRVKGNTYIVDRLFAVAELRLGSNPQTVIKIIRNDAVQPKRRYLFSSNGDK